MSSPSRARRTLSPVTTTSTTASTTTMLSHQIAVARPRRRPESLAASATTTSTAPVTSHQRAPRMMSAHQPCCTPRSTSLARRASFRSDQSIAIPTTLEDAIGRSMIATTGDAYGGDDVSRRRVMRDDGRFYITSRRHQSRASLWRSIAASSTASQSAIVQVKSVIVCTWSLAGQRSARGTSALPGARRRRTRWWWDGVIVICMCVCCVTW